MQLATETQVMIAMTVAGLAKRALIEKNYYYWWSMFAKQQQQTVRGPTIILHDWLSINSECTYRSHKCGSMHVALHRRQQ